MTCSSVTFLGTGAAVHPHRAQSSVLVDYMGYNLMVDSGCSVLNQLSRLNIGVDDIDYVVVTHGHYDHICGLGMISFVKQFTGGKRLKVLAPASALSLVEALVSAGAKSSGVEGLVSMSIERLADPGLTGDMRYITLEAIPAVHTVDAYSIAITLSNLGMIVISGDTRPTFDLARVAQNSLLTVHEATYPSTMKGKAEKRGHSTVAEAIHVASKSELGARYHLTLESEAEALRVSRGTNVLVPEDLSTVKIC